MKTIIAGSKSINDYFLIQEALNRIDWKISEVVSSGAQGVDALGERYAKENNISVKYFKAEREMYGNAAETIRNVQMAKYADALVWICRDVGASNLIYEAKDLGLRVVIFLEEELRNKKQSNPIKNNPIFGDEAEEMARTGQKGSLATKTVSLNGKHLVVYEDHNRNQPIVNMVVELIEEVSRLRGK